MQALPLFSFQSFSYWRILWVFCYWITCYGNSLQTAGKLHYLDKKYLFARESGNPT